MKSYALKNIRIIMLIVFGCAYMMARYLFDFSPLIGWITLVLLILCAFLVEKLVVKS